MNELTVHKPGILDHENARAFNHNRPLAGIGLAQLRYAIGVLHGRWRLAAAVAAFVFAGAAAVGFLLPHNKYCQALLIIHPISNNLTQPASEQNALPPDTSAVDTEVEVLRSAAVAEGVVKKFMLYQDPEFGGRANAKMTDEGVRRATTVVESRSSIRRIGLTYAVQVGFTAHSIAKAKEIADGIIDVYLSRKLDQKLATVTQANRDLGATLGGLRQQALTAASRVERYKAENHLLGADATASTETELTTLDQRISEARADAVEKQARAAAEIARSQDNVGGSDVATNTIGTLRQKEAEVSAALSQLTTEFRSDYPLVKKTEAELQNIRGAVQSEARRIVVSLHAEAAAAQQKEASLIASREQAEEKIAANNRAKVGLLTLQQAADSSQKIYETYLTRASEAAVARSLQRVDATVESHAIPIAGSLDWSPRLVLAIACFLALIGVAAAIVVSESWSRKIRSWNDVADDTRLPLASVLPDMGTFGLARHPALHIAREPLTAFAESLRSLRAFLVLSAARSKIIAVTSSVPGEGKTLVSISLARTLVAAGSRVLLLDCDLRNASASKFFHRPEFGIAEIVTRSIPIEEALTCDPNSGIWFLPGSTTDLKTGDIFCLDRMDAVLRRLSEQFDHVIIDTSPLLGFADARILASKADSVVFVVRWNATPASLVRAAMEILRQCGARVAGTVLNRVNVKQQARFGFADGSDYYHHYGSAYSQQL
jgi:capsular exopolysaccharide synthesis family protein